MQNTCGSSRVHEYATKRPRQDNTRPDSTAPVAVGFSFGREMRSRFSWKVVPLIQVRIPIDYQNIGLPRVFARFTYTLQDTRESVTANQSKPTQLFPSPLVFWPDPPTLPMCELFTGSQLATMGETDISSVLDERFKGSSQQYMACMTMHKGTVSLRVKKQAELSRHGTHPWPHADCGIRQQRLSAFDSLLLMLILIYYGLCERRPQGSQRRCDMLFFNGRCWHSLVLQRVKSGLRRIQKMTGVMTRKAKVGIKRSGLNKCGS